MVSNSSTAKVCIYASYKNSNFANVLIHQLSRQGHQPALVICEERSKGLLVLKKIRSIGFRKLAKLFSRRYLNSTVGVPNYLKTYATEEDIPWNQNLIDSCAEFKIPYLKISSVNAEEAVNKVNTEGIDLIINTGSALFRKAIIAAPKVGILNAHMGYLPTFRGFNVLEWSLFYNHKIGVSLHYIAKGIDTGDVLLFKEIEVEADDTIERLRERSKLLDVDLMLDAAMNIRELNKTRKPQLPEEGKQYYAMHPQLKAIVEKRINNN